MSDREVAQSARIWNYWLGGSDNFPADRAAGDKFLAAFPGMAQLARESRQYLARAVRYLAGDAGMRQFLDVGAGLPTADNTHQIAQRVAPDARVVYVDKDPYVLEQAGKAEVSCFAGDLEDPDGVLAVAGRELDLEQPVALVLNGVLGHLAGAPGIVEHLVNGLPRGSYVSISDGVRVPGAEALNEAQDSYNDSGAVPYILRSPSQFAGFFAGLELVPPGVVPCPLWRPEPGALPGNADQYGGIGSRS